MRSLRGTPGRIQALIVGFVLLVSEVTAGSSQQSSAAPSSGDLAKEITNPVTSLWQLQFQFNNVQLESSNTP